ncbi:ABC transporter permease [Allosalinactinospora lopnorensis]|uniref:ABC transporter permease n=1 Tax=Allosalinactinospora lopnorensis TaxID=1352348 RepID=UPI000623C48F|nr:iron ABC transporter permease [Allosalinactinospora lopnorensis]
MTLAGPRSRRPGGTNEVRPGRSASPSPALLGLSALVAGIALLPLVYLLILAFQDGWQDAAGELFRETTLRLVMNSLGLAAATTVGGLVIGVGLAWLIARTRLPGRRMWALVATLPLAIPSYVAAFVWISAFPWLNGFDGSVIVLTLSTYPYIFLPVLAALGRADRDQEEVARSLGKGPVATFFQVTARQVQPAAAAGALLAALYVLSDFGSVSIMRYDTFTRIIFARANLDHVSAALLSCVLIAITVLILWGEARSRGRARFSRVGAGATRARQQGRLGVWTFPAVLACAAVAGLAVVLPLVSIGYWLVRGSSAGLDGPMLLEASLTTLAVSAAGAALATVLALPVGVLAARNPGPVPQLLERITWLGYSLPGIVVALSLVYFAVHYAYPLYQESPLLVFAYALLFLPAAVGAVRSAVAQSPPGLEEVARSLGSPPPRVFARVTLPLATPGIAAGAALVFLTCMKELPATLLLRPTGMETMATRLWTHTASGAYGAAAPYAALLVVLAAVPAFLLGRKANGLEGDR